MSTFQNNAVCPAILVGIEEIIYQNQLPDLVTPIGFAQALLDPTNRGKDTVVQNVDGGEGHPKVVRIKRKQPAASGESTTSKTCVSGVAKPYFEDTFTVNMYRQMVKHIDEATLRTFCEASSALTPVPGGMFSDNGKNIGALNIMNDLLYDLLLDMDGLRLDINADLLAAYAVHVGDFVGGSLLQQYEVYRAVDATAAPKGSVTLDGFNKFKRDMNRTTLNGQPILFGEGNLDLAMRSLNFGCCNTGGTDFGKMNGNPGMKYYTDFQAGAALGGANVAGVILPGMAQFASYSEYVGSFDKIGTMERGTMRDPKFPGITYDIRFLPNECGEYYDLFVGLHFDLYVAPINLFKSADRRANVNGTFRAEFLSA